MYRRLAILVIGIILLSLLGDLSGCVYYNTFYNAKREFGQAEKYRKKTGQGSQAGYKNAIDKALAVIENHPNSKYYDDALFVLAVSYYYTGQPSKSEHRFRELLANYPDSKYSKEATLYLARAKMQIDENDAATDLFDEIFQGKYDRRYKAEAALEMGKHYLSTKEPDLAQTYFLAVRDSLGDDAQKLLAQNYVADAFYDGFKFGEALKSYLQILGMKPSKESKYHALFRAALCSYKLQRINAGQEYLQQLIKDPLYFDSLGALDLAVAQGHEAAGDLEQAEATYIGVATESKNNTWVAEAYYQLALIYQYDYDNLRQAKIYYDKVIQNNSGGESGQDAMQRSADIAKLQNITEQQKGSDSAVVKAEKDTTTTEEDIQAILDGNASTLYQLGELYWFQLGKQDTAILEMENLLVKYPSSAIAPRAMLALAAMRKEFYSDTLGADSLLREAVARYPQSDYLPDLLDALNMKGSAVDTGYASYYYRKAEDFYVDSNNVDSAIYYYQYVIDHFPKSDKFLQAKFNIVWLRENYRSPGDSSIVFAYQEIADSFPNTPQGVESKKRVTYKPPDRKKQQEQDQKRREEAKASDTARVNSQGVFEAKPVEVEDSISRFARDPRETIYVGPKGERLILLDGKPSEQRVDFDFPPEASSIEGNQIELYYQILLDFSGKVKDYVLKTPSTNDEINRRAGLAIASMSFDPLDVNRQLTQKAESITLPEEQEDKRGRWYVYKFVVEKPDYLR